MTSAARLCSCDGTQGREGAAAHPGWLDRVDEIVERGKDAYHADDLLQEAGDSLMMKLGEAANRLSKLGVLAPEGVEWALAVANRNFIIHQYDEINRAITWQTLSPSTCLRGSPH
jgi:uncharacterized protein with HEPN domain